MQRALGVAAALMLTACTSEKAPSSPSPPAVDTAPDPVPPGPPGSDGRGRKIDEKNDLMEFGYAWPAQAEAQQALRVRFEREMVKDRTDTIGLAEADRKERREHGFPFNPYSLIKTWSVSGETPLLLALTAETYSFTGGAHGNTAYEALVWDKQQDRAVDPAALFPLRLTDAITPRYCDALNRERQEKRGEPVPEDRQGMFNECPPIAHQTLTPLDGDNNGRFDAIGVLIGPYEAGPYAEGSYELELPIDAATFAEIPDPYRDQFEVRR